MKIREMIKLYTKGEEEDFKDIIEVIEEEILIIRTIIMMNMEALLMISEIWENIEK
jgi:hypothetical protein